MKKNIGQKLALYICPIRTISSDVQELNAATFSLIMIWYLSVPNAATATLLAKIELIFRFIPATWLQTSHITTSSQKPCHVL